MFLNVIVQSRYMNIWRIIMRGKKLILTITLFSLTACKTITSNYSELDEYMTFEGLPCSFNGVRVEGINNAATVGKTTQNCHCNARCGYRTKEGQTLHTDRGRPVVAIADMKLISALNRSAQQRTGRKGSKNIRGYVSKPYDDLRLEFEDTLGNTIVYYHLQSENPFVPGFGKGKCEIPLEFQTERAKRYPVVCGGIVKTDVKKGDLVGYVGSTGGDWSSTTGRVSGEHISLGIYVTPKDPRFTKSGLVVPSHNFTWENKPTSDPMKYLLPIQ